MRISDWSSDVCSSDLGVASMDGDTGRGIPESLIEQLERDGAVLLPGIVGAEWLDPLREAIERDIANPGPYANGYKAADGRGRFHGNSRLWEREDRPEGRRSGKEGGSRGRSGGL